ncbi:MAG: Hint domain-containing protein [Rhodobacteraceae bacterium]|nr:Hint domain-containing protein [Paracoccaceae bacterium]
MWTAGLADRGNRRLVPSFFDRGYVWPELAGSEPMRHEDIDGQGGILTGTLVATHDGWRPVETIAPGDLVLTFDEGLTPVLDVNFARSGAEARGTARAGAALHVPPRALDNRQAMTLLPGQKVLLEADLAEALFGDPFVLIAAGALAGYRGIVPLDHGGGGAVVSLVFDRPQVVHAEGLALLYCPEARPDWVSMLEADVGAHYSMLSPMQERRFVAMLRQGETTAAPQVPFAAAEGQAALSPSRMVS